MRTWRHTGGSSTYLSVIRTCSTGSPGSAMPRRRRIAHRPRSVSTAVSFAWSTTTDTEDTERRDRDRDVGLDCSLQHFHLQFAKPVEHIHGRDRVEGGRL